MSFFLNGSVVTFLTLTLEQLLGESHTLLARHLLIPALHHTITCIGLELAWDAA